MQSRHNGDFRRSLLSALAAMVAAAVPSLVPATALAEPPNKGDNAAQDTQDKGAKDGKKADKKAVKKAKKAEGKKAQKPQKPTAKQGKQAQKPPQNDEPKADAKQKPGDAAAQKGKKSSKKTASRAGAAKGKKVAKKADSEAPQRPCKPARVTIDRAGLEGQAIALFDCHKRPSEEARRALSVLARPWGAAKPLMNVAADKLAKKPKKGQKPLPPGELAPGVRWLDKGLLTRLDAIAHKFKDRPISLVSGYRPASRGSQHQTGRALDLRVAGVSNEELVAFCKTLPDTGCGYYPNSSFVHIDVRNPGTGTVSWIDASGPGEAPRYVTQWPLPQDGDHFTSGDEPHDAKDPWAIDPFGDDDDQEQSDDSKKPPPKRGGNFI